MENRSQLEAHSVGRDRFVRSLATQAHRHHLIPAFPSMSWVTAAWNSSLIGSGIRNLSWRSLLLVLNLSLDQLIPQRDQCIRKTYHTLCRVHSPSSTPKSNPWYHLVSTNNNHVDRLLTSPASLLDSSRRRAGRPTY